MLLKKFFIKTGVIIKPFELCRAGQLEQVLIAGVVLGQQQQVVGALVELGILVPHPARGKITFQTNDGFYAGFFGCVIKFDHAKHGAVIGDGHRRHAQFLGARHQLFDITETVKQRIMGVDMQVDEGHGTP